MRSKLHHTIRRILLSSQTDSLPTDKDDLAHFLHARHRNIGLQVIKDAIEIERKALRVFV